MLQKIVFLQIPAKLEVVDALLESDQCVIQLHVELGALLEEYIQVVCNHDGFVDLLEELALGGVVAKRVQELLESGGVLLDHHRNLLLLLLECFVLAKMLRILRLVLLENFSFLKLARVDLHELLNCIELVLHGHSVIHDFFFALSDFLELVQRIFDCLHRRVLIDLTSRAGRRNHSSKFLTSLCEQGETLLIGLELALELRVSGHSHLHFALVLRQAVLVLLVNCGGRWPVEFGAVLDSVRLVLVLFILHRLLACG